MFPYGIRGNILKWFDSYLTKRSQFIMYDNIQSETLLDIHNISVQGHKPLQMINTLTATGWGKKKETPIATYKAFMRPALEYASSICSPLTSWTSMNKLQVMQNTALRTTTGCT